MTSQQVGDNVTGRCATCIHNGNCDIQEEGRTYLVLVEIQGCEGWTPDPETESELGLGYREGAIRYENKS